MCSFSIPKPYYSVIIPLKDEYENLPPLLEEIEKAMTELKEPWELICIDDGSTDDTRVLLSALTAEKPHIKAVFFSRNFGQSSAFAAGFQAAAGDFIISLDGDGQNDPADIPKLIAAAQNADLVCGWRVKRRDSWSKRLTSRCANAIRKRLCGDGMQDTGCSLKVYRKSCLQHIKLYHGLHRFLPALFIIEGFRVCEVPVNHRPRLKGKTKYSWFNRSFNTIADLWAVCWMRSRHLRYEIEKTLP